MLHLENMNLDDDIDAAIYFKQEAVTVVFATSAGLIDSREGPNRYQSGDALVTGSDGTRWSVSRGRFDARYAPQLPGIAGQPGEYHSRPLPVLARQIDVSFCLRRSADSDLLQGQAGDWVLQYAPGDHGIVENTKFQRVYRRADLP